MDIRFPAATAETPIALSGSTMRLDGRVAGPERRCPAEKVAGRRVPEKNG
jgi:hypothetical protein